MYGTLDCDNFDNKNLDVKNLDQWFQTKVPMQTRVVWHHSISPTKLHTTILVPVTSRKYAQLLRYKSQ